VRGVRVDPAQPGAPGQEPEHAGPAQPRPDRDRRGHRRPGSPVRRLRRGPGPVRVAVHRGRQPDEGVVDRAPGDLPRRVLAAREPADGAQAVPEAIPAAVVRRGQRARAAARQAADSFPIAKRVYIGIDDDTERARDRMNAALEGIYGQRVPAIEAATVTGTTADCVGEVNKVAEAGAELILFTALFDQREQMERLAAAVLPKLG